MKNGSGIIITEVINLPIIIDNHKSHFRKNVYV